MSENYTNVLRKWLKNSDKEDEEFFYKYREDLKDKIYKNDKIEEFMKYVNTHCPRRMRKCIYQEDILTAGAVCYIGGSLILSNRNLNKKALFLFSFLYMLVDYYVDKNEDHEQTKEFVKNISKYLKTGKVSDNILYISNVYEEMIEETKDVRYVLESIKAEMESYKIQTDRSNEYSKIDYKNMASKKGGKTIEAIVSLNNNKTTPADYLLGQIIQYIDDIMDVEEDISLSINTFVTKEYAESGNIDEPWIHTVLLIDTIDSIYNALKPMMLATLIYAVNRYSHLYSSNLYRSVEPYLTDCKIEESIRTKFYHVLMDNI